MNILRTKAVELQSIPAIAYKQKLASGGAGLKLTRLDADASAVMTIDKRTGETQPFGTYDEALFPDEAFDEAMELTMGLPYSARGKISLSYKEEPAEADEVAAEPEAPPSRPDMIESEEYKAIVARYMDEKGKLNYPLMNKDFIQFAAKSKVVADLVSKRAGAEDILICVVKSRAALIAGKKDSLDDDLVAALIDTLDEIDPRSAFKELKQHIKRMLSKEKK